jgi:hypothetical protein
MRAEKKRRLEAAGWRVGSAEEFLGLTAEEATLVELRLTRRSPPKGRSRPLRTRSIAAKSRSKAGGT